LTKATIAGEYKKEQKKKKDIFHQHLFSKMLKANFFH
jgi:hypothetical protein